MSSDASVWLFLDLQAQQLKLQSQNWELIRCLEFYLQYSFVSNSGFLGRISEIDLAEVPFKKKFLADGPPKQRSERIKLRRTRIATAKIAER